MEIIVPIIFFSAYLDIVLILGIEINCCLIECHSGFFWLWYGKNDWFEIIFKFICIFDDLFYNFITIVKSIK
jgi:hypothetical protein